MGILAFFNILSLCEFMPFFCIDEGQFGWIVSFLFD
jgi:hypothetical protein